jgi:hypothetical protein
VAGRNAAHAAPGPPQVRHSGAPGARVGHARVARPRPDPFNWRPVAGTDRLSAHSFGISIDINTGFSDYWRWAGGGPDPGEYRNRIPLEIVLAFEAEDFIWGGRWYHYDTMHFEYRPELRHYQRLVGGG